MSDWRITHPDNRALVYAGDAPGRRDVVQEVAWSAERAPLCAVLEDGDARKFWIWSAIDQSAYKGVVE